MKRFLKRLLITLIALVILFFTAVVVALYLIDPNQFKDELAQVVKNQTGRELSIEGDISVSIFPWLGFEIGRTQLSNAPGFGNEPMLHIEHAEARVRLLSLFRGEPQIATLVLQGLRARLSRDQKGETNWADLTRVTAAQDTTTTTQSKAEAAPAAIGFPRIEGVRIENAQLIWQDRLNNQTVQFTQFDLRTGMIALREAFPVAASFDMKTSAPDLDGNIALKASAWLDPQAQYYRLTKLELHPQLRGEPLPGGQVQGRFGAQQLNLDLAKQQVHLDGIKLALNELNLSGQLGLRNFARPQIDFKLRSDTLDLDRLMPAQEGQADADKAAPAAAGAVLLPLNLIKALNVDGQLDIATLIMSNLTLTRVQLQLTAADGVLKLLPQASLYGGSYRGNIRVDATGEVGKVAMQETLAAVQIQPLLQDFLQKDYLSGETNLQFRATAKGNTLDSLIATLNGVASLKVKDAQLKSKHVLYDVAQAITKRQNLGKPEDFDKQVTVFDRITGQFNITDGLARNDDLLALSERVHIQGQGYLNLVTKQLDYTAYLIPKKSLRVPWVGGRSYDLKDQPIPYHVHGTLDNLKFDADFEEVFKRLTQQRLESIKKEKQAELQRKLEEEKRELQEKQAREKQELEEKINKEKQQLEEKLRNKLLDKLR